MMNSLQSPSISPPQHPIFGHLSAFRQDALGFLTRCARHYGPVVPLRMLHKPAFLLLDSADIEHVLVTDHKNFIKPAWLHTAPVRRVLGDGLVTSDGADWRRQHHACQPAFHPHRMEHYGALIAALASRALTDWQPGQSRLLQKDMAHLALQVVAHTLLDVDETGWSEEASAAVDTLMARFTAHRSLFGMIPLPASLAERQAGRQLDTVVETLLRCHAERPETMSLDPKRADMLSVLRGSVGAGGEGMRGPALRGQVKTFLSAGHESSALTLVWAFLLLARAPDVEAALWEELENTLQGRAPAYADLPNLPYTRAIVQETLRLYPPVWMTGRQSLRPCEIGGFRIPAGAFIMTSQWAIQRLPQHFPCPDAFRPERWLNGETTDLPRFAYFPFGGGPRICIGQNFALVEAILLLATIAQRFRLEPESGSEFHPWPSMTLRPPAGILMRLTARTSPHTTAVLPDIPIRPSP
ncbi:MAG: ptlI [Chthonomonadaceae bacterium]|nr:ptlI [Chthonomonadaceae bacterium]